MERPYKIELSVTLDDFRTETFSFSFSSEETWNEQYELISESCVDWFVRKKILGWRITRSEIREKK